MASSSSSSSSSSASSASSSSKDLLASTIPDTFPFPFQPYDVQVELMRAIYGTLEHGGVGLFESPTGTGKSLSIISSSLHWLLDRYPQRKPLELRREALRTLEVSPEEPDWVRDAAVAQVVQAQDERDALRAQAQAKRVARAARKRARAKRLAAWKTKRKGVKKNSTAAAAAAAADGRLGEEEEEGDLLVDWRGGGSGGGTGGGGGASDVVRRALKRGAEKRLEEEMAFEEDDDDEDEDEEDDDVAVRRLGGKEEVEEETPKIIYCSRTHSQLSQFVQEVKKTEFGRRVKCVSLASRVNLCVHPDVVKLGSQQLINDRCLDMMEAGSKEKKVSAAPTQRATKRSKAKKLGACEYLRNLNGKSEFEDTLLTQVLDIEELHALGTELQTCPYYGTRKSVHAAHLVTMPYSSLLHAGTREALGIKLKGNIVIIDEAHNLIETVNQVHSARLTAQSTKLAREQLNRYWLKYQVRLKESNAIRVKQVLRVCQLIFRFLSRPSSADARTHFMVNATQFGTGAKLDQVNLFEIVDFIDESDMVRKLYGFVEKEQAKQQEGGGGSSSAVEPGKPSRHNSPMRQVVEFLRALTNADADGRVLVDRRGQLGEGYAQFLMLNPAVHFTEIVNECRAVVLAGGTMQPFDHFVSQLFAHVPDDELNKFSCGHVVSPNNLLALSVPRGPSSRHFNFSFSQRTDDMIRDLGLLLINVGKVVPDGVVCFFASYAYEEQIWTHLEQLKLVKDGALGRKPVFREQKGAGRGSEAVLAAYSAEIQGNVAQGHRGALLSCVMGGKMSEGINFSNELARCVVVVGLPYPNRADPELQERMAYLNAQAKGDGPKPGDMLYQNLCMRAVNQSIGRAIRHQNDYACILLVDQRFAQQRIATQIPGWIKKRLVHPDKFGQAYKQVREFFREKGQ